MPYKYYILEENVPGRWIYYFYEETDELYKLCENFCSEEEFWDALVTYRKYSLKKEILKAYIKDYLVVNEQLLTMSDGEFEKFITSAYKMTLACKYSNVDIYRKNILLDADRITLIDNRWRDSLFRSPVELDEYFIKPLFISLIKAAVKGRAAIIGRANIIASDLSPL